METKNASFTEIRDLLDTANELLSQKEDLAMDWFDSRNVNTDELSTIVEKEGISSGDFATMEDADIDEYWERICAETPEEYLDEYRDDAEESLYLTKADMLKDVAEQWESIVADREQITGIEREYHEETKKFTDYATSEEYDQKLVESMEAAKKLLEEIPDTPENSALRKQAEHKVTRISQRFSLDYLYTRFDDPKTGPNEVTRITTKYFDRSRSDYLMKKFRDKCEQFGLATDIVSHLFNIEENFLEEEFHVYNNLYLFFIMEKLGYANDDEIEDVKQAMRNLINLVYNRFYSADNREIFLESMRGFLRRFEPYREVFNEKNILHPNHPHRIQKDAEMAAMEKAKYLAYIEKEFPEAVDTEEKTEEFKNMSLSEVMAAYSKLCEEKRAAEEAETATDEVSVEEAETSTEQESEEETKCAIEEEDEPSLKDEIAEIVSIVYEPIKTVEVGELYPYQLYIYEELSKDKIYIIGVCYQDDVDNARAALTVLDPYTEKPVAEINSLNPDYIAFSSAIKQIVTELIPEAIVCVKRNSGGNAITIALLNSSIYDRLYYTDTHGSGIVTVTTEEGEKTISEAKNYGLYITENIQKIMDAILQYRIECVKDKFITRNIIADINSLTDDTENHGVQVTAPCVVACVPEPSMASLNSYLITMYILRYGISLSRFGLVIDD